MSKYILCIKTEPVTTGEDVTCMYVYAGPSYQARDPYIYQSIQCWTDPHYGRLPGSGPTSSMRIRIQEVKKLKTGSWKQGWAGRRKKKFFLNLSIFPIKVTKDLLKIILKICLIYSNSYPMHGRVEWFVFFLDFQNWENCCRSDIFVEVHCQKNRHLWRSFHIQKITAALKINVFYICKYLYFTLISYAMH